MRMASSVEMPSNSSTEVPAGDALPGPESQQLPNPAAYGPDLVVVGALAPADAVALPAASLQVDGYVHVVS